MPVNITQNPVLEDLNWFNMNSQGVGGGAGPFPTTVWGTPTAVFSGPWQYAGKLYSAGAAGLVMPHPPPDFPGFEVAGAYGPMVILSSADAGVTWAAPDVANRPYFATNPLNPPPPPSGVIYQRIGNKIHFTMLVAGVYLPPWASGNAFIMSGTFDMATDTYGPVTAYDTGWPSFGSGVLANAAAFLWPVEMVGTLMFVGQDEDNRSIVGGNPNPDQGKCRLLAGPTAGLYAALTDITPAAFTGVHFLLSVVSVLVDATGVAHVVFSALNPAPGSTLEHWYMRLYPDLHTDALQQLVVAPPGVTPSFGVPSFNGTSYLIPAWHSGNTVVVVRVSNYSAIAPVVSYEPIVQAPAITNVQWTATVTKGSRSVLFWCANPFATAFSRLDYSINDGFGWSIGAQFCDDSLIVVPPGDYNSNGGFSSIAAALLANGDFGIVSGSQWQQFNAPFFLGNANIFLAGNLGADPPLPVTILSQGFRRTDILIPNHFDKCLVHDLLLHLHAGPRKACCRDLIYYDIINVRAPAASIPFRKVAGIPTPLAAAGDVVVLDFQVPSGYDGLVAGCFNIYTGPGFLEGGGDIEWRILINKVYAVQLGQILVTLGSRAQAYPIDGGIQIQSGQRIRYIVNVPNLSGGILPINSQIVCGLEGLFYARQ